MAVVSKIQHMAQRYREQIMYLIFGMLATLISIAVFGICIDWLDMDALVANLVAWIAAVMFAFFTNRKLVFCSREQNMIKQFCVFISGRVFTLLLEELIFILLMAFWDQVKIIKIIGQAVVIVTNYFISKLIVFRTSAEQSE